MWLDVKDGRALLGTDQCFAMFVYTRKDSGLGDEALELDFGSGTGCPKNSASDFVFLIIQIYEHKLQIFRAGTPFLKICTYKLRYE